MPLAVGLPGEYNRRNALTATATAAAAALGEPPVRAASAVAAVRSVAHRYAVVERDGQPLTLLLAKNPAGGREIVPLLSASDGLLVACNAREADGRDTSWVWTCPSSSGGKAPLATAGACCVLRTHNP